MNIQKVKEALELAIIRFESFGLAFESVGNIAERDRTIRCIEDTRKTLAELENPVDDDASLVAIKLFTKEYVTDSEWMHQAAADIQQYAEYYHAKKCAKCKKKIELRKHDDAQEVAGKIFEKGSF